MFEVIKGLEFNKRRVIHEAKGNVLSVFRPYEPSKTLRNKDYDSQKNFQIWLQEGKVKFRPNHLRIMIDLNLRARCRPDLKRELLWVFDRIFYRGNPDEEVKKISGEKFSYYLNPIEVIANMHQLFIIEQEHCYNKESKYRPKSLFYQGWIREVIDNPREADNKPEEIDNMCMSICRYRGPKKDMWARKTK